MDKTNVFRREEAFKEWLPHNNVVASTGYYVSNIKAIQNHLQIDVDKLLSKGLDDALERVTLTTLPYSKKVIQNCRSVLKKYWEFTQDDK